MVKLGMTSMGIHNQTIFRVKNSASGPQLGTGLQKANGARATRQIEEIPMLLGK